MAMSRDDQGLPLKSFYHYAFNAGENKGEAPTFLSKSELSRSLNVENRTDIATRYGSSIYNVDGDGYADPIATNPVIKSIFGHSYSTNFVTFFVAGSVIYADKETPTSIKTGMTSGAKYQGESVGDYFYFVNNEDNTLYFDPDRSTTALYTVGYDTPAAFTATPLAVGGSMAAGDYEYYVTLYDENTDTESNRQLLAVEVTTVAATSSVTLNDLPLDAESRTSHWRIYRKDPTGYYHYRLTTIPYDAGTPTYTDTEASTGAAYVAPIDNFRPEVSRSICKHKNAMVYASGSTVWWSKDFRYQMVPTENSEPLEDKSTSIQKVVSFGDAVVVFKERTIYVFLGDLNQDYIVKLISADIGTLSPDTVKVSKDGIYFLDSGGRPRVITPTDFTLEDLRDQTDISYKYRNKLKLISNSSYSSCFAVLWETSEVSQYRLFAPVSSNSGYANHCYVFDRGLAFRNNGDSSWFDFRYNLQLACGATVPEAGGEYHLACGDNYGLLWRLDRTNTYYDGDEFIREEGDGAVTFGANTITISTATMEVDRFVGMEVVMYNTFTYQEIFRSKISANTATQFTVVDALPTLPTANPYITVGGYLTYFGTANYTHDRAGRSRPFKMSILFNKDYGDSDVQIFTHYDFNETFNYTYEYINNSTNSSLTPLADNYSVDITSAAPVYDSALYGEAAYSGVLYGTIDFLLNSKYLFNHVSWGAITRAPSEPFGYLGATFYYQFKAGMT